MIKSLQSLALNITEQEYRALEAFSYSGIATFFREGPKSLTEFAFKDSSALRKGSLFDTLLTEPEELNEKFIIASMDNISDKIRSIVDAIYAAHPTANQLNEVPVKIVMEVLNSFAYQTGWKPETRYNKVLTDGSRYFELLKISLNKKIISQEDYDKTMEAVNYVQTISPFKELLINNPFNTEVEGLWQLKFTTELNGIMVKCMFDRTIVDHDAKIIYPIDIKTTGHLEEEFQSSFIKWNYYIQADLYTDILRNIISMDEYFKDFVIAPFSFLVVNVESLNPIIWEVTDRNKINRKLQSRGYVNYRKLLEKMSWHFDNQLFNCSMETYLSGFRRTIDLPFIADSESENVQ